MSTRRRIGISTATTEAARRQLMQPVPCWEKVWIAPQDVSTGPTLKVYKWVKTNKRQNFSDDEGEPDLPLAPLPEMEAFAMEGEEEMEDDPATSIGPDATSRAVSEPAAGQREFGDVTPVRPTPHPLSISHVPGSPTPVPDMGESELDVGLKRLERGYDEPASDDVGESASTVLQAPPGLTGEMDISDLDMSQLGPDGAQFEGAGELNELQTSDVLLGGEAMDQTGDPFGPSP